MDPIIPTSNPIDSRSGFNRMTRTFHSLRTPIDLPPDNIPMTAAAYALTQDRNSPWSLHSDAFVDGFMGQRLSYSELIHQTQTLIVNLKSLIGLSKGDTAFVLTPNLIQTPVIYLALLSLGVVVSPGNPVSTESEITHQLDLCKPLVTFATSSTVDKLQKHQLRTILVDSPEFDSLTRTTQVPLKNPNENHAEVSQFDTAAILYSSGTTGKVKGVMLSHRNLIAMMASYIANRVERKIQPVSLTLVPLFHVYGFTCFLKSIAIGETVVLLEKFEMRKMLKAVELFKVTRMTVVPPLVVALTKGNITEGYDLSSLEAVGCGGAPLANDIAASFSSKFPGVVLAQGYGLTETTATTARSLGPVEASRRGSVGKLLAGFEAKIIDPETGETLPPGKPGELWIRGPFIMKGYIGDQEATSATLSKDGWLRTGDLCYFDDEGFLYIQDRLKELIKYKGYQVPPAELENLLLAHPNIIDAAVIPYPDEEAVQVPMAFVVRKQQSYLSEAALTDFVAQQVAPYKKIRRVVFVESIPKNAAGKILRRELVSRAVPTKRSPRL